MAVRGAAARRAGHQFERDVANYLGVPTTRSVRPGIHLDYGDLVIPGWVVECKNYLAPPHNTILAWLTAAQAKADPGEQAALIVKARNRPLALSRVYLYPAAYGDLLGVAMPEFVGDAPVAIDLYTFRTLLTFAGAIT